MDPFLVAEELEKIHEEMQWLLSHMDDREKQRQALSDDSKSQDKK